MYQVNRSYRKIRVGYETRGKAKEKENNWLALKEVYLAIDWEGVDGYALFYVGSDY